MSIMAPKGRKHLSADALFRLVRRGFEHLPEHRCGAVDVSLTEARMSVFAMFSLTSPSLLACDKERAEGNLETLDGTQHVPCDTSLRALLDPVSPESLRPVCKSVFGHLQRGKALEERAFLAGHSLLCLDGTGSFASQTMPCASCVHKVHRNGSSTYAHHMLGAAMVHPDVRAVMPLMPEAMVQHEGTEKNDGARHAAQRCIAKWRKDHPHLTCIVTDESLSSHAPTSRPCPMTVVTLSSGAKKAIRPLCSTRCRRPSTLDASPMMNDRTVPRVWCSAFVW